MVRHSDFIRTILDNPDDAGPRLVFADWLEEQGDERAATLRSPGRWVIVTRTRIARRTIMGDLPTQPVSLLVWEGFNVETHGALIGAVVPSIKCERIPGDKEREQESEQQFREAFGNRPLSETFSLAFDTIARSSSVPHYDTAATRLGNRWLCWSCATSWSRRKTTEYVRNLTEKQIGEQVVSLLLPKTIELPK